MSPFFLAVNPQLQLQAWDYAPPVGTATFDLSQPGAAGISLNLLNQQQGATTQRSPFAVFNVQNTDHTSAAVTVNTRGMSGTTPYVAVYANGSFVAMAQTTAASEDATGADNLVTATVALPAGLKNLHFRTGSSRYGSAALGYQDPSLTKVVLSGGTQATAYTPAKQANFFAVLGDSIWSSVDPAGTDPTVGMVPKLRAALPAWDVVALSGSGAQLVLWYATPAKQLDVAQRIAAAAAGYTGKKVLYIELSTNDFGAGNTPLALKQVLTAITDQVHQLDASIRIVYQTATYRNIEATPTYGYVLEEYRQAMRDAATGRGAYVTLLEGEPLVSQANFYPEAQVLHPNPAGQDQVVAAIGQLLSTIQLGSGAVYSPPAVADTLICDYEGDDFTDSTGHHLDLAVAGTGTAPTASNGLLTFTYPNGQYLSRAAGRLDYLFGGFRVDFSFQYAGNADLFHWIAREYGVFDVTVQLTSGATIGQVAFSLTDAYGQVVSVTSAPFNVATGLNAGTATYNLSTASLTVNGATVSTPLASLNPRATEYHIGEAFGGTIDYVKITQLGTGGVPPVPAAPTVTTAAPNTGSAGTQYSVQGTNLLGATVAFGGVAATQVLENSTAGQIVVAVPSGFVPGNVTVTNNGTTVVAGTFAQATAGAPTVSSYSPYAGIAGDLVTIVGTSLLNATATFNGLAGNVVQNVYDTQTLVRVPVGATYGDLVVTNGNGISANVGKFTIGIPPQLPQLLDDATFQTALGGVNWTETGSGGWQLTPGQALRLDNGVFSRLTGQTSASQNVAGKTVRFKITVGALASGATLTAATPNAGSYNPNDITAPGVYYATVVASAAQQTIQLTLSTGTCTITEVAAYVLS